MCIWVSDEIKVKMTGSPDPDRKTNTSLLLDEQGKFLSFGSMAREGT
jgi:hypothetical protein